MTLEYLAGFFDGEGCISRGRASPYWEVVAVQTVKNGTSMLTAMQERWGGCIVKTKPRKRTHSPAWYWKARGLEAAIALYDMAPFLVVKKRKAIQALSEMRPRRRNKIGRILARLKEPKEIWNE